MRCDHVGHATPLDSWCGQPFRRTAGEINMLYVSRGYTCMDLWLNAVSGRELDIQIAACNGVASKYVYQLRRSRLAEAQKQE